MIVIAERLNATRKRVARALEEKDAALIARETRKQTEAGASFIDVNAGSRPDREVEDLKWMVEIVQDSTDLPLCLDSANPEALRQAVQLIKGETVMLNSVNGEPERIPQVMPIAAESGALLVALAMDERGLPDTVQRRLEVTEKLVKAAAEYGIDHTRLFVDPCIQPLSTSAAQATACIEAVRGIMTAWEGIHTTGGLSNVSFGLPDRHLVNSIYVACMIQAGYDSAIIDPTAPGMMPAILAAEAIAGKDDYCMNYVMAMK